MTAPLGSRHGEGRGGSIYDLGYRGYEGPRLGRRAAFTSLITHSLRTAYGLGRSVRSKVMPMGLVVLATLPAMLALGMLAIFSQFGDQAEVLEAMSPVKYSTLFPFIWVLVFLFCASQAPELFGRDQQTGVLPMYFSRAVSRLDYAVARMLGLWLALLVLVLAPQIILLIGRVMVSSSLADGLAEELPQLPAAILGGMVVAGLLGSLAAAIASMTSRRAYATIAIIAVYLIPGVFAALLVELETGLLGQLAVLLNPLGVLDGLNSFLFGVPSDDPVVDQADIEGWVYAVAAAAWIAGSLLVLARRYQRIET